MTRKEDYDEIKLTYNRFVKAWETNDAGTLDMCTVADLYAYFSIFEDSNLSRDALKEKLFQQARKITYSRFDTTNYACLIEGGMAQQSAYLIGLFSDDSDGGYEHYAFCGAFCNRWEKRAEGWRMTECRFDLNVDDANVLGRGDDGGFVLKEGEGNLAFVKNWLPITDRVGWFQGVRLPAISGEYDAPWYVIKHRENIGTDEEQIEELFYQYCFAVDYDCFKMFDEIFMDDAVFCQYMGYHDKRHFTNILKINRSGSRRCQHMGTVGSIQVHGNTADVVMYGKGPASLYYPYKLTKENETEDFVGNRWVFKAVKQNGKWCFTNWYGIPGAFMEKDVHST